MKLVEDLGIKNVGNQGCTKKYGVYECPMCHKHFSCVQSVVNRKIISKCSACSNKQKAILMITKAALSFIPKAIYIHGDTYNYDLVEYTNNKTKVRIICKHHGEFLQEPRDHLKGRGCPNCAITGFNKNKPAILYYLRITTADIILYKIGITNRSVEERFTLKDMGIITVLKQQHFTLGKDAYLLEQKILKLHNVYKYTGVPVLSSGNTELFTTDILGLDN